MGVDISGRTARGFPSDALVFEFEEAAPLSRLERARWAVSRLSGADNAWREERTRPGPLRTTDRYNSVDLLGGITRVGEYYATILIGGQRVRVQVDVSSPEPLKAHCACCGALQF